MEIDWTCEQGPLFEWENRLFELYDDGFQDRSGDTIPSTRQPSTIQDFVAEANELRENGIVMMGDNHLNVECACEANLSRFHDNYLTCSLAIEKMVFCVRC